MNTIHRIVERYFHKSGDKYVDLGEKHILSFTKCEDCVFFLNYNCVEEAHTLVLIGQRPDLIPEGFRPQVAELLTRANCYLKIGNFGMDYSDGEFHFRIGVDVQGSNLSIEMVDNCTGITRFMLETMYPCIKKLINGEGSINKLFEEWKNNLS